MDNIDNIDKLTPAKRYYKNHLKAVSNYQKRHPHKMHIRNAKYYSKIKQEDHEQYLKILEDKKITIKIIKKKILKKEKNIMIKIKIQLKNKKNYIILMLLNLNYY